MALYPYKMQLVVDPDNPRNVVAAGSVSIYDSEDLAKTTLLTLTDPSGVPIPNPITSNANGFTPPFVTTSPEVLWVSGPYVDFFQSYKGMRDEAVAAVAAAEAAAATAGAEAAVVATAAIGTATADAEAAAAAATAAEGNAAASATAAASAAALVNAPADTAVQALINASGSATKAALNATYAGKAAVARLSPGGTRGLAFCGDSNSAAGVTGAGGVGVYNLLTAPTIPTEDNSWIGWAILSGAGRFHAAVHAATPSITPDVWNTQFLSGVIAQAPYAAVDVLGTNNVENLTQQIAALTAMYDAFDAAGIKVIVCSIPPKAGFVADVQRLNRWKRAIAKRRGYLFVDNYSALVDPATGTMLAAYDSDGTHFNAAGARAVGLNFGATIAAAWPYTAELAVAQPAPADLVVKPLLLNKTGGGGFAPEDWSNLGGLGSVTTAVETVAGVVGKMFTITQGATPADANAALTLPANLIAGHRYVLAYKYQLDVPGTAPTASIVRLEVATGGGTSLCSRNQKQAVPLGTVVNEFTAPSGLSAYNYRLRVQLNGGGTGTKLWIGQVTMFDLTAAGL